MLLPVEPERGQRIRASLRGWIGQHDPDFAANGRISVFNNNDDNTATGEVLHGSSIVEMDPLTREARVSYGGVAGQHTYSEIRGKNQVLDNGNLLITEAEAGRVFEVTPDDAVVWEFINRFDDDETALVSQGARYAPDYFSVSDWTCGGGRGSPSR